MMLLYYYSNEISVIAMPHLQFSQSVNIITRIGDSSETKIIINRSRVESARNVALLLTVSYSKTYQNFSIGLGNLAEYFMINPSIILHPSSIMHLNLGPQV